MRISDYIRTYSVENGSLITSLTGDTWGVLGAHMTAFGSGYTGDTATVTVTDPSSVTGGAAIEGIVTDGEIRSCRVTSAGQYQQAAGVIDTSYYYLIARLGSSSFTGADEQGRIFLGNGATISGTGYVAAIPILTFGGTGTGATGIAIIGPTSLDAIPTLDLQEGKQVSVRLDDTTLSMWRLVAATDAEDGTTVIRPGDYDDLPVKMVWKLQTTSTAVPANLSVTTLTTTGNVTSGGDVILSNSGAVRLPDADGSNYIELQAANVVATNTVYKFPEDGAAGQVLSTNGSGVLSWATTSGGTPLGGADQTLTSSRDVNFNGNNLSFTGSGGNWTWQGDGDLICSNVDFYWGSGLHRYGLYSNAVPVDGDYWFDAATDREAFRNTNTYYKSGYAFVGIGGSAISITAGTFFECLVHPTSIGSLTLSANTFDQSRIIRIIHNAEMFYTNNQQVQWRATINGSNVGLMSEPANFSGTDSNMRMRFAIDIIASNNGLGTVTYTAIGTMTYLSQSNGSGNTWVFDNSASVALSSGAAVTIGMGVSYNQSNDEVYIPLSTSVEII